VRDKGNGLVDDGVQIDRFLVQRSREARKVRNSASTSACVAVGTMFTPAGMSVPANASKASTISSPSPE